MIYHFSTFEEAALFSQAKQQEGYFSEILHLNSGFIYGSIASNGFPVLVSECAARDNDMPPKTEVSYSAFLHLIAKVIFGLSIVIVSIPLMLLCFSLVKAALVYPVHTAVYIFDFLWKAGVFLLLFSLYIQTLIFIFQAFKDDSSGWNQPAKTMFKIVLLFVVPMIILTL